MHITTRSLLAVKTLMVCAAEPDRLFRKHEIAALLNASENHLAQVIHLLARKGFLATQRGRAGGMRLARQASTITVGEVLRGFEADLPLLGEGCNGSLAGAFRRAEEAFYRQLDGLTVSDLLVSSQPLKFAAE